MKNLIRTTITLPADILQEARIKAVLEKTTLSGLIRKILEKQIAPVVKSKLHMQLGKYSLNIKGSLRRKELYEDYLKRKVPTRY